VIITWIVLGMGISWLCSWIWPLYFRRQNVMFYIACAIYFVVSMIAAFIVWRIKLTQSSDA
jgi:hypothetical protein